MQEKHKFCKDCHWFDDGLCKVLGSEDVSLVYGLETFPPCYRVRCDESLCGSSGKLFEQNPWRKFW